MLLCLCTWLRLGFEHTLTFVEGFSSSCLRCLKDDPGRKKSLFSLDSFICGVYALVRFLTNSKAEC